MLFSRQYYLMLLLLLAPRAAAAATGAWRPPTAPSTVGLKWRSLKLTLLPMQHYTITQ